MALSSRAAVGLLWALALVPLATVAQRNGASPRQTNLLANNCLQCHARPNIDVPLMGKTEDWKDRVKKGEDELLKNVVQGLRGMPPLGYCSACTEEDLRVLTRMVAGLPEKAAQ